MAKVLETKYLYQGDVAFWLDDAVILPTEQVFAELFTIQENILRWAFTVLDNSNPDLAKLSNAQRNALYGIVYGDAYTPLLETTVQKNTAYPYNYRLLGINMDFDEQYEQDVKNALQQMQKTPAPLRIASKSCCTMHP